VLNIAAECDSERGERKLAASWLVAAALLAAAAPTMSATDSSQYSGSLQRPSLTTAVPRLGRATSYGLLSLT